MGIVTNKDRAFRRARNKVRPISRRQGSSKPVIAEGELRAVATPGGVFLYTTIGGRTYKTQMPMTLESGAKINPTKPVIKLELLSPTWADAKYEMARNLQRILRALGFKDSASKGKMTEESGSAGGGSGEGGGGGNLPPPPL
jgi:uncharacterized membrane protein YgcG